MAEGSEERKGRGFFGRAFFGGFFGCLGVGLAIIVVIVVIVIIAVMAAGGGDDEAEVVNDQPAATSADGQEPPPEEQEEPDVLNLAIGDTAKVGDAEVTVHGSRTSTGDEFLAPEAGNVWVIVDATVKNTGDDAYNLSSVLQTSLRDGAGREYDITIGPTDLQGQLDGTIPPGDILRGEVAFEVPEDATGLQFVFAQALGEQQARWNLE